MEKIPKYILLTLIALSIMLSIEQWLLGTKEVESSEGLSWLWTIVFSVLVGLWAQKDNNGSKFSKPFEFGYFVYFMWPLILPYYLYKTRGIEGFVIFIGVLALFCLPSIAWLFGWAYA